MRPSSILALALLLPLLAGPALGAPDDDPRPIVPASEILAKIERGEPVEYDGVIVEGDLDLSGLDLPTGHVERNEFDIEFFGLTEEVKLIESPISIKDSEIKGDVNLGNSIFQGQVNFKGSNFSKEAWFSGANFSGHVEFWWMELHDDSNNSIVIEFGGSSADFMDAKFSGGDANFWRTEFSGGDAEFGGAEFSGGDAEFGGAEFSGGSAEFGWAKFNGGVANFAGAEFSGGSAIFYGAEFSGGEAAFDLVKFNGGLANFIGAVFSGGSAEFWRSEFSEDVDFEDSIFERTNLTMEDARNIRILRLSNSTFENCSTISLKGTDYDRLYVRWDLIEDALVYNGEVYLALVKNFKAIEYFEDADDCYYQYRLERQSMRSFREVAKYTDILGWVTCGYGVRPGYTLLLGLFVVFVSAVYYWRADAIRRLKGDEDESAKFSDAFYFSMMTFTTVGYGDWYPLDRHRNVVMIEGIVGWLTLSLFLVTLANVIIR